MDRQFVYDGAIPQAIDILSTNRNVLKGLGLLSLDLLGSSTTVTGFSITPAVGSLAVVLGPGRVYTVGQTDSTAYGDLGTDSTQILKQGISAGLTLACAAPGTSGQSINYLIEAQYQDSDGGSAVIAYYNAANPASPLAGPGGSNTPQNTVRQGIVSLIAKAGTAAPTGTQTTPAVDSGYTGLYVVTVTNGQISIPVGQISTVSGAPFLSGVLTQISGDARYIQKYGQSAAEAAASVTPTATQFDFSNLLRFGLVPNITSIQNPTIVGNNTSALQALFNPSVVGPTGRFYFPNTTGSDIYYLNGIIQIRDGVRLDLGGCTINFSKSYAVGDNTMGFFSAIRDVTIENGSIVVNYNGSAGVNAGAAIRIGSRPGYPFGIYSSGIYDQDNLIANGLPPMGNITLRNLNITSNNPGAAVQAMIMLFGGLRNVIIENVKFNGQAVVPSGIYYEYGFASTNGQPGTESAWTSSHATNMYFRNIEALNLGAGGESYGVELGGSHHCIIENLVVDHASGLVNFFPGEAMFYRPWVPTDAEGAKRSTIIRGATGTNLTGNGMSLGGSGNQFGGYLSTVAVPDSAKVDLMSFDVSNFSINATGCGISVSGPCDIRNGRLDGTASSSQLLINDDCVRFNISGVEGVNSNQYGLRGSQVSNALIPATITAGNPSIAIPSGCGGMVANEAVYFATGSMGSVTGLTIGNIYYVLASGLSSAAFQVSATPGGTAITPGGSGTATPSVAPARLKIGTVSDCLFAGNQGGIGAIWSMCSSVTMQNNRFGYSVLYDGQVETQQNIGVDVSYISNGGTVICDGNFIATASGTAYNTSGTPAFGVLNIRNPKGENTVSGIYEINGVPQVTGTVLAAKAGFPNSFDKYAGKMAYNQTTNKAFVAQGAVNTSTWISVDGLTTVTPS